MTAAPQRKLARLQRLERMRALARHDAAGEAARAEGTLAQLQALAARSGALATQYTGRTNVQDGADLRRLVQFTGGLETVCCNTRADAVRAQALADRRQSELAAAERRRAAVADRAAAMDRAIAADARPPILTGRRRAHGR